MQKQLTKSNNKMISGVCAGIAEYFNLDPTLVRVLWVIFCIAGGSGVLAYIVCLIVMPNAPYDNGGGSDNQGNFNNPN